MSCPLCGAPRTQEQPHGGTHMYTRAYTCGATVDYAYNSTEIQIVKLCKLELSEEEAQRASFIALNEIEKILRFNRIPMLSTYSYNKIKECVESTLRSSS